MLWFVCVFFFKQKTAYEMRISDWSSDVCSSDLVRSLLGILENGQLTLAGGSRTLDFRNSLIFMTSNIGARHATTYRERFSRGWRRWLGIAPQGEQAMLELALHAWFEPEFINRIDSILVFQRIESQWREALDRKRVG